MAVPLASSGLTRRGRISGSRFCLSVAVLEGLCSEEDRNDDKPGSDPRSWFVCEGIWEESPEARAHDDH